MDPHQESQAARGRHRRALSDSWALDNLRMDAGVLTMAGADPRLVAMAAAPMPPAAAAAAAAATAAAAPAPSAITPPPPPSTTTTSGLHLLPLAHAAPFLYPQHPQHYHQQQVQELQRRLSGGAALTANAAANPTTPTACGVPQVHFLSPQLTIAGAQGGVRKRVGRHSSDSRPPPSSSSGSGCMMPPPPAGPAAAAVAVAAAAPVGGVTTATSTAVPLPAANGAATAAMYYFMPGGLPSVQEAPHETAAARRGASGKGAKAAATTTATTATAAARRAARKSTGGSIARRGSGPTEETEGDLDEDDLAVPDDLVKEEEGEEGANGSGSGKQQLPSSSSLKPGQNPANGRSPEELLALDPKKVKRILANRLSAARSKERRQAHTSGLHASLQASEARAAEARRQAAALRAEAAALRAAAAKEGGGAAVQQQQPPRQAVAAAVAADHHNAAAAAAAADVELEAEALALRQRVAAAGELNAALARELLSRQAACGLELRLPPACVAVAQPQQTQVPGAPAAAAFSGPLPSFGPPIAPQHQHQHHARMQPQHQLSAMMSLAQAQQQQQAPPPLPGRAVTTAVTTALVGGSSSGGSGGAHHAGGMLL